MKILFHEIGEGYQERIFEKICKLILQHGLQCDASIQKYISEEENEFDSNFTALRLIEYKDYIINGELLEEDLFDKMISESEQYAYDHAGYPQSTYSPGSNFPAGF